MLSAPIPANDSERLKSLGLYSILDTSPERCFDNLTFLASQLLGTPIALISLVDRNRQWFKSRHGLDASETPRSMSICGHTILGTVPLIVADASLDPRFSDNPLVTGDPHIRFYAGTPLIAPDGQALGTLCAIDRVPRTLTAGQIESLSRLGEQVVMLLELRRSRAEVDHAHNTSQDALRALHVSNEQFRLMVDSIGEDAIVFLDEKGHVSRWNESAQRLTGHRGDQIIGHPYSAIFLTDDANRKQPELERDLANRNGRTEGSGWRVRQDGSRIYAHTVLNAVRNTDGALCGYVGVIRDLTEQHQSETQRQQALDRFTMASDAAGLGFWEFDIPANTLVWDDAMYKIYGRSRKDSAAPYALWARNLHVDDRARTEREVAEAIAGSRPFNSTFRIVYPNEEIRHIKASAKVTRDEKGQALLMYGVNVDVTETMTYTSRLSELVRDNAALIDALNEHAVVSIADQAGRIIEANDAFCALSGYARSELLGNDHRIVNSGTHPRAFWQAMWKSVSAGKSWRGEVCNRAKDGSLYWVDSLITRFVDPATKAIRYQSIRFDITPLKRAQSQLTEKEEFLESAAAMSGVGGFRLDLRTGDQMWTRQAFRIYDVDGTVAPNIQEASMGLTPETLSLLRGAAADARRSGQTFDVEIPMATTKGRQIWARIVGAVESDNGAPARVVGAIQDITLRREAEKQHRMTSERLALAIHAAHLGIWEWEVLTNRLIWDEQMYSLYGRTPSGGEEQYALWASSLHPDDREKVEVAFKDALAISGVFEQDFRIVIPGGAERYLKAIAKVERDTAGNAVRMVGLNVDITDRKMMERRLLEAAQFDKLTGLANRPNFMARLEKTLARVRRGEQRTFSVLFLDFDRFKLVNDTLGHDAGDELLRQIAVRMRGDLRASDVDDAGTGNLVSRFGGDEFLVLLNDLKSPDDAVRVAERLLVALTPSYKIHGTEVFSSASIGIVSSDVAGETAEGVVANADAAMYEAKRSGRGCSVVFNEAMHTRLTRHLQIETSLRRAIGTDELSVAYQPIVELATGRIVSAEALVRWNHPVMGAVGPSEFIPIAEESGLIVPLDDWVMKQACREMARWQKTLGEDAPSTISVNLSRAGLALGKRLLDKVQAALAESGLPAQRLQLEVTEREVMRNPEASLKLMHELRSLGVKLAMDDFGTGTSSLAFLRDYPFDTIKIDRSFVQGLTKNPDVLSVIHATVILVENLGMASLVEGVESESQVAVLISLGCRYAQGYLFSHPVPSEQLMTVLRARTPATQIPASVTPES